MTIITSVRRQCEGTRLAIHLSIKKSDEEILMEIDYSIQIHYLCYCNIAIQMLSNINCILVCITILNRQTIEKGLYVKIPLFLETNNQC